MQFLKDWWRPTEYHVEYFRGMMGMCGHHDEKCFSRLKDAQARMRELMGMSEYEIARELGFVPSFLRILSVISGNPLSRFLNACGRKSAWRFRIFGREFVV